MKEFIKVNKVFIKSNNTTNKIFNRYLYCLIPFILLIVIYNLIWGSVSIIFSLLKAISISLIINTIIQYIFNIINNQKKFSKIFLEDKILTISIILGLFSLNSSVLVIVISSMITTIIKNINKNISISSSLYGILFIFISKYYFNDLETPLSNLSKLSYIGTFDRIVLSYGSILEYTIGLTPYYLSPILSIVSFIYLFSKKSIKYNIVFSYVLTISFIMLFFGIFNNMNIWYLFFELVTGNLLFLTVFCLTDYPNTPTTGEGQLIYGIVLGLITSILRFIIPELSVIISMILGPLLFTKIINRISFKLKYNKKFYYTIMSLSIFIVIITTIIINIII